MTLTRPDLIRLIAAMDLQQHGYGPPAEGSHHYDERLATYRQRVQRAMQDAATTLDLMDDATTEGYEE